ncbi:MAG: SurA N-terminal domain-containing protein [Pseudomonadales bacterium]|nr:SurA N-terminal domain-containing protein [Pseudomonadales bacterium]MBO6595055.1 SurA N-terminal domain-containing protein [Pseudomonadales bacterium]MBO6821386.1 SurA N-terminal domain-containing protein [Pseudomonadales bacterium]
MVIQKMRDGSEGILAKVIIGLIIIVFALFGFGSITTFLAPVPKVATVNGSEIAQAEMEFAVERNRRLLLARGIPIDQINEDELRANVLEGLISRALLSQAADEFSLYYSDAAIDADIVSTDMFQLDGVFNGDQFQNVIRSAGYTPLSYRDELRTDKLFDQLLTGIRSSAFLIEEESKRYGSLLSQSRDIAFIEISAMDLIDEVIVEDEDIQLYYEENTSDFVTDETVNIEFVELKHDELAADLEIDEEALALYFSEIRADYATDESRRVAHILIEVSDDVTVDDAKSQAAAVYQRILDGENFADLAQEVSDDAGSSETGGDLGFNPQGTFFPEFEAVAYDLGMNEVSEPVETEIGFHIIRVLDIEEAVQPELEDVRVEVEIAYRLSATEEDFVSMSSRLAELLFESIDLEVPAEEIGLEIQTTGHLTRAANHFLMVNKNVSDAAFSPDVLLDGNNSDLIELSEDHLVGIRVLEHNPSETRALSEVSEDIRFILQRQKATDLAQSRAEDIVAAIKGGSLAQFVADEYGLAWSLAPGATRFTQEINPQVLSAAFKLPRPAANKESLGASTMQNGDGLIVRVSRVENKPVPELMEAEIAGLRQSMASQLGLADFNEFERSLNETARINTEGD